MVIILLLITTDIWIQTQICKRIPDVHVIARISCTVKLTRDVLPLVDKFLLALATVGISIKERALNVRRFILWLETSMNALSKE
jgi:hypothetical protein